MNNTPKMVSCGIWVRFGLLPIVLMSTISSLQAFKKDGLNIFVRSVVSDAARAQGLKPPDAKHHEIYLLAPARQLPSAMKLAKPVDPKMVEKASHSILEKKGYVRAMQGDHPDMVITVSYGRGYLSNPYMQGVGRGVTSYGDVSGGDTSSIGGGGGPVGAGSGGSSGASVDTILFPSIDSFGPAAAMVERQRQFAAYEKLVIIVSAFDFGAMLKKKAKLLWRTTMYIDDPDHRDLNQITKQLLAAGADYFDRKSEGKEVEISKPLPEGYVEIGRERVVEHPAAAAGKKD